MIAAELLQAISQAGELSRWTAAIPDVPRVLHFCGPTAADPHVVVVWGPGVKSDWARSFGLKSARKNYSRKK